MKIIRVSKKVLLSKTTLILTFLLVLVPTAIYLLNSRVTKTTFRPLQAESINMPTDSQPFSDVEIKAITDQIYSVAMEDSFLSLLGKDKKALDLITLEQNLKLNKISDHSYVLSDKSKSYFFNFEGTQLVATGLLNDGRKCYFIVCTDIGEISSQYMFQASSVYSASWRSDREFDYWPALFLYHFPKFTLIVEDYGPIPIRPSSFEAGFIIGEIDLKAWQQDLFRWYNSYIESIT